MRLHWWVLVVWVGPGGLASWWLRESTAWVNFQSWFAIVYSALATIEAARTARKTDPDDDF